MPRMVSSIGSGYFQYPYLGSAAPTWQTMPVGGGGYMRGIDVSGSTLLVRSDTPPALWTFDTGKNKWVPLITAYSMPSAYQTSYGSNAAGGCMEARICPSLTSKFYMFYGGTIGSGATIPWVSTNSGATWTAIATGFPSVTDSDANQNGTAETNHRMAVDPVNDAVVYIGTPSNGLQKTSNSGASWTTDAGVTASATQGIAIAFDPSSPTSGSPLKTQGIFACSNGQGVWHSTDAGANWTKLNSAGMPTTFWTMICDQNGKLWVADGTNIKTIVAPYTTWVTNSLTDNPGPIAVDPNNASNVACSSGQGRTYLSTNGGSSWTTASPCISTTITAAGDAAWIAWGPTQGFQTPGYTPPPAYGYSPGSYGISMGAYAFDSSSNLYCSHGFGILKSTSPFATPNTSITWQAFSRGTEALDATQIVHPPNGNPVGTAWDLPIWNFPNYTNPTIYPAYYGPTTDFNGPMPNYNVPGHRAWWIEYASSAPNPAFLTMLCADGGFYSNDGGVSWTIFPDQTGWSRGYFGGSVASSTSLNHVVMGQADVPYYTTNNGGLWQASTYAGVTAGTAFYPNNYVCADRVTANKFYIFSPNDGFYSSTNSGQTFTKVSSFKPADGQARFRAVPGQAGHVFWTPGIILASLPQTADLLYWNTNSAASSSAVASDLWNTLSDFNSVFDFGFGTTVSGSSYPTIYLAAYRISTGVLGVYKCTNFNSSTGAGTWTLMTNSDGTALPEGAFAPISGIAGDPSVDGRCCISYVNGGFKRYA